MTTPLRVRIVIDSETKTDYVSVEQLYKLNFPTTSLPQIVKAIRKTTTFNQKASIVARVKGNVVGHVIFSSLTFVDGDSASKNAAFIGPLVIAPDFSTTDVKAKLIDAACQKAAELGYDSVYLTGAFEQYSNHGFSIATATTLPITTPAQLLMKNFAQHTQSGLLEFTIDSQLLPDVFLTTN